MLTIILLVPIIAVVIAFIIFFNDHRSEKKRKTAMTETLSRITGFDYSNITINRGSNNAIAYDEKRKEFLFIEENNQNTNDDSFPFNVRFIKDTDIISSEVSVSGVSITKTQRGSQLGSAIAGGVLFGGAGAVVGGLSGATVTTEKTDDVRLTITVDDTTHPVFTMRFLTMEVKKPGYFYDEALKQATHWHAICDIVIKRNSDNNEL